MNNMLCQLLRTAVVVLLATWTFTHTMAQTQGEYFIDEDPGLGYATPVSILDDGNLSLVVSTTGLSPGNHVIGIRVYNTTNEANANVVHYGPTVMRNFSVLEERALQNILYAEYFWGDDPGYGKGISIPITLGEEISFDNLQLSTKGMAPGDYTIGFRALGTTGWGPTVVRNVTIIHEEAPQTILYAEYFWDEDPGYGKGIPLEMEEGEELSLDNLKLSTNKLEPGSHTIGFRALGTTGWGPTVINNVEVMEYNDAQEILYAEYFWDEDPGYGKGIPLEMEEGEELSLDNLKLSTNKLEPGSHTIGFRALGTTGWGPTVINNVEVMEYNDAQEILYAEYFWDADPGYGKGTPIDVVNGDSLVLNDYEINVGKLATGDHVFGFRVLGTSGWSPTSLEIISVVNDNLLGDVNNDGLLSLADAVCIISWLLEQEPPVFREEYADFNEDGNITNSDAVAIILYLLDGGAANAPMARAMSEVGNKVVGYETSLEGFDLQMGTLHDYTAMMMDVTLPEGETLQEVTLDGGHSLAFRALGEGRYRIAAWSMGMEPLRDGAVLHCTTSSGHTGRVVVDNLRLVDMNTYEFGAKAVSCEPTGISEVTASDAGEVYHTLGGVRVARPGHGVYVTKGRKVVK